MSDPGTPFPPLLPPPPPAHLHPRIVPWRHALAWYEEAMRLWKRAPVPWALLALATLATELGLQAVPAVGTLLGKVVTPLVGCGMVFAAAAADRGKRPPLRLAAAAFRARGAAIAAILTASFVTFAAEGYAAWWVADVNVLAPERAAADLSSTTILGIYAIGVLASLPVGFVPFHVLLEEAGFGEAFAASWQAFTLNTGPLLVYAAASMLLLGIGLMTMGIALVVVLPLWTAASYAAWKDVFGVRDAPYED
ncbi:MAG: hypothetical protein IPG28_07555 [Betaproteobacteria bacterium]|nr:hypothetical protein [Betaproteobacteria bacterium]MBK7592646.1 hypothetical protein [Betaproteobacteria bacterium]MBK7742944.1 hypothetical protein [Betaproteobacteria bacterium]MBK8688125.1 hypothetical protein [Betaproteobacteria bacterium]MBK9676984.1 hypothetical protein [Betaproteobacteria bacterium]